MLHPHGPARPRRVYKHPATNGDADMSRLAGVDGEEDQVAGRHVAAVDPTAHVLLLADRARQPDLVLKEHVLDQAAAIDAQCWVGSPETVGHASQCKRSLDQRLSARSSGRTSLGG